MLPGMPPDPAPPTPPKPGVRVSRYRPTKRLLCAECVAQIHLLGVAHAPPPMPVRWQVTEGSLTRHLCETHKNERLEHRP